MGFAEGLITGIDAADRISSNAEELKAARIRNENGEIGLSLRKQAVSRQEQIRQAGIQAYKNPPEWDQPVAAPSANDQGGGQVQSFATPGSAAEGAGAPQTPTAPQRGLALAAPDSRDSTKKYLDGLDAMHRKAIELGDMDSAAKLFEDHEGLRMRAVNNAMDNADRQMIQSGGTDYSPYLDVVRKYLPPVPNAPQIKNIVANPDGKTVTVTRAGPDGKEQTAVMDSEAVRPLIDRLRDPAIYRAARIANEKFAFQEKTKADEKVREESEKARAEAQYKGVEVGPGGMRVFPSKDGKIGPDRVVRNDKTFNDKGFESHVTADGSVYTTNKDTGDVSIKSGAGGQGNATDGWPAGTKLSDIEGGTKSAGGIVLDLKKNPTIGFDTESQDEVAQITANAQRVYLEGKGKISPAEAANQAFRDAKRDKIINPKAGPKPRMPMPGSTQPTAASAPKNDGGVRGVQLFYGAR
jgi:hypothetical protein